MKCAPIDTEGPRFYVSTIEGYPISAVVPANAAPVLVASVIDGFYGSEHGRFASNDHRPLQGRARLGEPEYGPHCACGRAKHPRSKTCRICYRGQSVYLGHDGALAAAAERCAELNAWHEREGWGEDAA